jgi:hypothetical protein
LAPRLPKFNAHGTYRPPSYCAACLSGPLLALSNLMTPPPQPAHSQSLSHSLSTLTEITVAGCLPSRSLPLLTPKSQPPKFPIFLLNLNFLTFFSVTTASSFLSNQYPKSSTMATEVSRCPDPAAQFPPLLKGSHVLFLLGLFPPKPTTPQSKPNMTGTNITSFLDKSQFMASRVWSCTPRCSFGSLVCPS